MSFLLHIRRLAIASPYVTPLLRHVCVNTSSLLRHTSSYLFPTFFFSSVIITSFIRQRHNRHVLFLIRHTLQGFSPRLRHLLFLLRWRKGFDFFDGFCFDFRLFLLPTRAPPTLLILPWLLASILVRWTDRSWFLWLNLIWWLII